jgi:hypothetical protein
MALCFSALSPLKNARHFYSFSILRFSEIRIHAGWEACTAIFKTVSHVSVKKVAEQVSQPAWILISEDRSFKL